MKKVSYRVTIGRGATARYVHFEEERLIDAWVVYFKELAQMRPAEIGKVEETSGGYYYSSIANCFQ